MQQPNNNLIVSNLNKVFGRKQILYNISFKGKQGRIVGLIGANGAGKTTIMKSILGLTKSSGSIVIKEKTVGFNKHRALNNAGALIEYPGLYPFLSGRDHLELFVRGSGKQDKIHRIINEMTLEEFIDLKIKKYSLGMKQKLGIALAMINQPPLIILDEPMNGLDAKATHDLRELIVQKSRSGTTFLISSHLLSEIEKIATDLVIIDHGHLIKSCSADTFIKQNKHYVLVSTDDNEKTTRLLQNHGYRVINYNPLKLEIDESKSVEEMVRIINQDQITLKDLQHEESNLEESILELLKRKDD